MPPPLEVLLCRGCCCGTAEKHPTVDHAAQLARFGRTGATVRLTDCLGECDRSNVVLVRRRAHPRRGGRDVWIGAVLTAGQTEAVAGWVEAGATGSPPVPAFVPGQPVRRSR